MRIGACAFCLENAIGADKTLTVNEVRERAMMPFGKHGVGILAAALICAAGGTVVAMSEPAQAGIPADCLNMDLTPYSNPETLDIKSTAKTAHFNVEIAATSGQREQGLMCRANLKDDYGMLFEFDDSTERTFWMKDTISGLDIIYIAADGRIVSIAKDAKPLDWTPLPSHGDATGVLEIKAGLSDKLGLKPGDSVVHPFFHKP